MKRSASFLLLLSLLAAPAFADGPGPRIALGPGRVLTGRFAHEHPIEGIANPLRTEGSFTLAPGNLVWAVEKPMATTTRLAGGTLTQSIGAYPLFQMTPAQMPLLAGAEAQIFAALSGDWAKLNRDYVISRKGDEKAWTVTLTPRAKGPKPFQKIVARGGLFVDSADIYMKKTVDRIVFTNQRLVEDVPMTSSAAPAPAPAH